MNRLFGTEQDGFGASSAAVNRPAFAFLIGQLYVQKSGNVEKCIMRINDKAILTPSAQWHPHRFPFRFIKSIDLNLDCVRSGPNFPG